MARWTEADWRKPPLSVGAVNSKYNNRRVVWQGLQFDSQKELDDYKRLKLQEAAGEVRAVIRQVSFPLQGSTRRIRVDFVIVENDGRIRWMDSKGFVTSEWELKQKLVRDAYGLEIETI